MTQMEIHEQLKTVDWLTTAADAEEGMVLRAVDGPDRVITDVTTDTARDETVITTRRGDRDYHQVAVSEIDNDPKRVVDPNGSLVTPDNLPELRDAAGLSRTDLAERIGVKETTVEQWETMDDRQPSRSNAARIERLFRD